MKIPTFIAAIAVTILIAGCGKKHTTPSGSSSPHSSSKTNYSLIYTQSDDISDMSKKIGISQVVAYASMDTNSFPNFFVKVSEIWKGVSEASALGITNGMQFAFQWSMVSGATLPGGHFPDHAILTIPPADSPSIALQKRSILFVYDGRILGMTIQEYKAKFGL